MYTRKNIDLIQKWIRHDGYFDEIPIQTYIDTPIITWHDQIIRNDTSIIWILQKEYRKENQFKNWHFSLSI